MARLLLLRFRGKFIIEPEKRNRPMSEHPSTFAEPADLEYLSLAEAAALCSVSEERFWKWVEMGLLPLIKKNGKQLVRSQDLIRHLIKYDIRLPERLLPGKARKILFISKKDQRPCGTEIVSALYRWQQSSRSVFKFIEDDENADLKIITFAPDCIFLLPPLDEEGQNIARFNAALSHPVPVRVFSPSSAADLDNIVAN